jgi:hypothetical protein
MSNPAAEHSVDEVDDDQLGDETMPLPALSHLLENTEPQPDAGDADVDTVQHQDPVQQQLSRLIEISESMNRHLERMAELLARQGSLGRPRTANKPTGRKSAAKNS